MPSSPPLQKAAGLTGSQVIFHASNGDTNQHGGANECSYWISPVLDLRAYTWARLTFLWTNRGASSQPFMNFLFSNDGEKFYKYQEDHMIYSGTLPRMGIYQVGVNKESSTIDSAASKTSCDGTSEVVHVIVAKIYSVTLPPFGRFTISTALYSWMAFKDITVTAGK